MHHLGVCGLSFLVLVSSIYTSTGLSIAPSPELLISPPQNRERASSPAYLTKAGNDFAPNSATLPQSTPPSAFLAPPLRAIPSLAPLAEPVESAPASPHEELSPSTFEDAPPSIHPVPSLQAPSPSQNASPGTISPSTDGQPKGPTVPAEEPSPSNLIPPPKTDVNAKPPMNSSPTAVRQPHASAPARSVQPHEPPIASPILTPPTVLAPPIQLAPQSIASPVPPILARSPISHDEGHGAPVVAPPAHMNKHLSPVNNSHFEGSSPPSILPHRDKNQTIRDPTISHAPSTETPLHRKPPTLETSYPPASAPLPDHQRRDRKEAPKATSTSLSPLSSPSHSPDPQETHPPKVSPRFRRQRAPPKFEQDHLPPPVQAPAPTFSAVAPVPRSSPVISPDSFPKEPNAVSPSPPIVWSLPPPPPNLDCNSLVCAEPLTNPPPGAPCVCAWPIRVGLRLKVEIYTFFPLVSEFAQEIASGMYMKQSQVRIMGANVASEQPEDSVVLLHLVPLGEKFDNSTAFFVYDRFWHKQIVIRTATFGDYEVLYVLYPGLPASPPSAPSNINFGDGSFGSRNNARTIKPLGVDIGKQPKEKLSGSMIALIIVSSVVALTLCVGAAWLLVLKERLHNHLPATSPHAMLPLFTKSSGTGHILLGRRPCSESASFSSSVATYAGSAKTFTLAEIDIATNGFDDCRIIGEGGFGRVYKGTLDDGMQIAVKVLKRDDLQGEREFLAEVEMLSRLHHRNLVKLIGICTEENVRCLIYELIRNGSVESHLHGEDKENDPLDWNARMKIALGAARGLAYLHEDSSPRVIHRDFKCSNILLEHDYTPKVSDFGLARAALDEGNQHISTQIMGTFGYVAPEYAMTGHLLVKSDVYSYGVVLLELLTGRKPVDMLRPPGQENLVAWARPLLTSADGLETIVDPALGSKVAFDRIAKVAAIASMCVQPEVSHRPFMGEVVQALKLVCNECRSHGCSQDELSVQAPAIRTSMPAAREAERVLLGSDMLSTSPMYAATAAAGDDSSSPSLWIFRSGPLRMGKSRQFWQRLRSMSAGSLNDRSISTTGTSLDGRSSE